jgi:phosphatidylserine/phosphatidylglycerophosphate/cardiolipin synthase-like enzyme
MKNKKPYQYPWRYNNTFLLLTDGIEFFNAMLAEIKKAKTHILLEAYLFESGSIANSFISELCTAKIRGVQVLIILDAFGTKKLQEDDKARLTDSGIELLHYNPLSFFHLGKNLKRDHRKLLVIDNCIAFIGGAGITDEFTAKSSKDYWQDAILRIEGDIAPDLSHSFFQIWNKYQQLLNIPCGSITTEEKNKARVLISAGTEKNEIFRAVITHIRSSKKRVWLMSPYFVSSWKIRRALRYAAKKGVDVRLVLPGPHSDHKWVRYGIQRYYHRLLKAKIVIYEFQPRFSHAKIILVDDWFTLGSSNLDRWNQLLNLDNNVEVYDQKSLQQVVDLFNTNFSESSRVFLKKWNSRNTVQHIKEWFSGIIIRGLGFISSKFKR